MNQCSVEVEKCLSSYVDFALQIQVSCSTKLFYFRNCTIFVYFCRFPVLSIKMTLIQYVIVRADLMKVLKWNIGAVIAQACHATAAINEISRSDEMTRQYLSFENIDNMHKCILSVSNLIVNLKNVHVPRYYFRFLIKTPSRNSTMNLKRME